MNLIQKEWNVEDTIKFISKYLNVYKKIGIKDEYNIFCIEEDYDTLDFNDVPYLIKSEINVELFIIEKIKEFENLLISLKNDSLEQINKYKSYILLEYNGELYIINYDFKGVTYSKINKALLKNKENYKIINFEDLKLIEENKNIKQSQKVKTIQK